MKTCIILLRGINVGGNALVPMADLRAWLVKQGFTDPRTLLQSGNVVLKTAGPGGAELEQKLEESAARGLKLNASFMVRTSEEWRDIIAQNPFPREAASDPSHLVVLVLKATPRPAQIAALRAAIPGREKFEPGRGVAYLYYPDGIGDSKLTPALLDRTLGTRGTARNWNTVLKIAALAASIDP